ncbi:MAG TPA: NrfD/PsrC family molybdoenzyme membrane anchor subunit, partial [Thermomicrobiaceae bacterium]|nr:NrfD/PsrC family molybdoenzyme membrane anchor subunit [Thermomicrobiaceae bacterium]
VDFDPARCIGCKSCMQACPYDAIYIDPNSHTAAKCNFCAHRVDQGLLPACVVVCPEKAIIAGDLDDPYSELSQIISREQISVRKPEQGTHPKVFYVGAEMANLSPESVTRGNAYLWGQVQADDRPAMATRTEGTIPATVEPKVVYDVYHPKPWGWRVATYLWTKSIGAGALAVAAILFLFGWATQHATFAIAAPVVGLIFLGLTAILLVTDLKRPDRFLYILTKPNPTSWLVWGSYMLMLAGGAALVWLIAALAGASGLQKGFMIVALCLAPLAAGYTAFLFGQAEGRDLWQSPLYLPQLLAQGVIGGASALLLLGAALGASRHELRVTGGVLFGGVAVSLLLLALEVATPHGNPHVERAVRLMTAGPYSRIFYGLVLVLGGLLPLVLVGLTFVTGSVIALVIPAAILALIGLAGHEWIWVQAGQDVPLS